MKSSGVWAAVLLAAAVSAVTHLVALGFFIIGTCGVSDTGYSFPAPASRQGLVCDAGRGDSWWGLVGYGGLLASAVLAVALAGFAWSRGGGARWVAVLAPVALPVLALVLLSLPADTCSEEDRRTHPAYACRTTP